VANRTWESTLAPASVLCDQVYAGFREWNLAEAQFPGRPRSRQPGEQRHEKGPERVVSGPLFLELKVKTFLTNVQNKK
jgi:hypothetical protein